MNKILTELIESEIEDLGNQNSREMNTMILNRFLENEELNEIFNPKNLVVSPYRHVWALWLIPFIIVYSLFNDSYFSLVCALIIALSVAVYHKLAMKKYKSQAHSRFQDLKNYFTSNNKLCALMITLGYNDYTKHVFSIKGVRSAVLNAEGDDERMEEIFSKMIVVVYPKWQKTKIDVKNSESIVYKR